MSKYLALVHCEGLTLNRLNWQFVYRAAKLEYYSFCFCANKKCSSWLKVTVESFCLFFWVCSFGSTLISANAGMIFSSSSLTYNRCSTVFMNKLILIFLLCLDYKLLHGSGSVLCFFWYWSCLPHSMHSMLVSILKTLLKAEYMWQTI